ncbi:IclR family transcriptional regulator [Pseudomonas sp. NBRC 100443]|uniref:IclR family transcriptional regulator n=1 Tax=Pseudomonas sp. NBRC 100443 TaxID=1113665 RepID=UPI0024A26835|nr:IclR family transcriptional regulator [Pseudomonas sp. NBRC 100443]GLU39270.1 transcriptional regulator [Pseudomonas sp. NBRC 100443]
MNDSEKRLRNTGSKNVGAVVHAIQILRYLASTETAEGATSIARATGISPSTVFNILRTLNNEKLVSINEKRKTYQLGLGLSELALGLIGHSYIELIQPELERLSLNHRTFISLWQVTEDAHIRLIARSTPSSAHINIALDTRLPELAGAAGRCIAAIRNLSDTELRRRLSMISWESPPSFEKYRAEVTEAARKGWGLDQNELYCGISSLASTIIDREGLPRFVISATGISAQYKQEDFDRIGSSLLETNHFIRRALFP